MAQDMITGDPRGAAPGLEGNPYYHYTYVDVFVHLDGGS